MDRNNLLFSQEQLHWQPITPEQRFSKTLHIIIIILNPILKGKLF